MNKILIILLIFLLRNLAKLVTNFFDKEKYELHYENFQIYLRLGLKLEKKDITYKNSSIHND